MYAASKNKVRALKNEMRKTTQESSRLNGSLLEMRNLLPALGLGIAARESAQLSDAYTNANSRLKLVTSSEQELIATREKLSRITRETRGDWAGTIDIYQRVLSSTEGLNISQARLMQFTKNLNQAMAMSGGSMESRQAAMVQLGQGLASGVLRGEELNSVMEQTPVIAQALSKGLGVNIGQLRAMAAEGKLTTEVVINAMNKTTDWLDGSFSRRASTIAEGWAQIGNEMIKFVGYNATASGASENIANALLGAADSLSKLQPAVNVLGDNIDVLAVGLTTVGARALIGTAGIAGFNVALATTIIRAKALALSMLPVAAAMGAFEVFKLGSISLDIYNVKQEQAVLATERSARAQQLFNKHIKPNIEALRALGVNVDLIDPTNIQHVGDVMRVLNVETQKSKSEVAQLAIGFKDLGIDVVKSIDPALTALDKLAKSMQTQLDKNAALRAKIFASTGGASTAYFKDEVSALKKEVGKMLRANISGDDVAVYFRSQLQKLRDAAAKAGATVPADMLSTMAINARGDIAIMQQQLDSMIGSNRDMRSAAKAAGEAITATAQKLRDILPPEQAQQFQARLDIMKESLRGINNESDIAVNLDISAAMSELSRFQQALASIRRDILAAQQLATVSVPTKQGSIAGARATGGMIQRDGYYMMHAGERVVSNAQSFGNININIPSHITNGDASSANTDWRNIVRNIIIPELAAAQR